MVKGNCTHYWVIDSSNVGVCRYCGEVRDFNRLLGRESKLLGLESTIGRAKNYSRKRGRPRKEEA